MSQWRRKPFEKKGDGRGGGGMAKLTGIRNLDGKK